MIAYKFHAPHPIQCWFQPRGPDSCYPFYPVDVPSLSYSLPEFSVDMPYRPTEFTQINPVMNQLLVQRAITCLDPQPDECVLDLFCGIGNFSLAMARRGAQVLGIEGSEALVLRAGENAVKNQLEHRVQYQTCDLFKINEDVLATWQHAKRWLIDPPRDGAVDLVKALNPNHQPTRIIYVSCNPATLARDAAILVHEKGYTLKAVGIADMFPHTAHVESIAWFEWKTS